MKSLSRLNEGLRRQFRIEQTNGETDKEIDPKEAGLERTDGIPSGLSTSASKKKLESLSDLIHKAL